MDAFSTSPGNTEKQRLQQTKADERWKELNELRQLLKEGYLIMSERQYLLKELYHKLLTPAESAEEQENLWQFYQSLLKEQRDILSETNTLLTRYHHLLSLALGG